jgi:hypothetical protein
MLKRSLLATLATLVLAVLAIAPTASAETTSASRTVPVTGMVTNTFGGTVGTFSGAYNLQSVSSVAGEPVAIAILTGTITDARTGFPRPVVRTVTAPLDATTGDATTGATSGAMAADRTFAQVTESCPILDLSIGAVHLNLLGLVIHLDPVHLNITAEAGDGALLGNLLCTVAHLLDPDGSGGGGIGDIADIGGLLDTVLGLLNQILGSLGL